MGSEKNGSKRFLKSEYGKVKSDLPAYFDNKQEIHKRIKDGKPLIQLESSRDIYLREE